uniref:Uncharacterized protein n=1 Tax=Populus alba TaxID=43335 RepID=A0A4U5NM22_POPAL|nr:hypothetical protein D5086_0000264040 [Populus alba]
MELLSWRRGETVAEGRRPGRRGVAGEGNGQKGKRLRLVLEDCYQGYTWSAFCRLLLTNNHTFLLDCVESTVSCAMMLLMNCASPLLISICFVTSDEGEKTRAKEDIEYEAVASPLVYGVDCCQVPGFEGRLMNHLIGYPPSFPLFLHTFSPFE